jgi:hypothetical protein
LNRPRGTRRQAPSWGLVLGVAVLCAWLWLRGSRAPSDAVAGERAASPTFAAAAVSSERKPPGADHHVATPAAGVAPRMALPPLDTPLAQVMPELVRAARAGDVGAACRLSYELHRCETLPALLRRGEASITGRLVDPEKLPNETPDSLEKSLADNMEQQEKMASICAGVKPGPGLEPWRLLLDAARAGHVPSMVKFAVYFPMDDRHFLADLDGIAAFHQEGLALLKRAEATGDPVAAYAIFWTYNGNSNMLEATGQLEPDPSRALEYELALRDIVDDRTRRILDMQEARLRHKLSPAEQREAERLGAQRALRYADRRGAKLDIEQSSRMQSAEACAD